jgi:outer membrane receptor protein involved in Fe transport
MDYTGNYIVQHFVNRSAASLGVYGSWSDAFGSFLDIPMMKQIYKTPLGYYNSAKGSIYEPGVYTPIDAVRGDQFINGVRNMLWGIYENGADELEQRFISSIAPTWKITDFLSAKARIATDYTTSAQEERNHSQYPASAYPSDDSVSGGYTTMSKSHQTNYGDIMVMFDKNITDKINLNANLGWQGRTEKLNAVFIGTSGGLAIDNVFQITNGKKGTITPDGNTNRKMELLKTAYVGTLGASYGDFVFVDLTGRQEKSSTLPKGNRDYFYPSASGSFLYTTAFRDNLPGWYDFGKLRLSYGIVGNAPEAYAASMAYDAKADPSGLIYNQIPSALGNINLKPETTKEFEIGLENKFFGNRAGFEVSYYERRISDMLFQVPLAPTSGHSSVWTNAGLMTNKGFEATVYGTPVETKDFSWSLRLNLGFNKNHIEELTTGVPFIQNSGLEGSIGYVRSYVGSAMGDYVSSRYKVVTDESSQYFGRRVVNEDGSYVMNSELEVIGNAMPKVVGGLGTTLTYKSFQLDIMTDFRYGGYVFNRMYYLTMDTGVNADTENREGDGFFNYTNKEGYTAKNGIILDGVVDNGAGGWKENETIIPYDSYISSAYGIGNYGTPNQTAANALFKNNWWKLRELALSYNLPKSLISQLAISNLQLSVFGRNLLYLYKAIPDYDPETSNGTDWNSQLVIGASAAPTRTVGFTLRATF